MYQNSALAWLPPHELPAFNGDTFPRKPQVLQTHKASPFQCFSPERLNNLTKFHDSLHWDSTTHQFLQNPLLWLTFSKENSRCHKISLFKSHWQQQHYNFSFHLNFSLYNLFMTNCLCAHTTNCCIIHKLFPSLISGSETLCKEHKGKNKQRFIWLTDTISQE